MDRPAQRWERRRLRSSDRVVVQVSRWDALKDPIGVIRGFAAHVAPAVPDAHLVYAGPAVESVTDDPEGGQVLAQAIAEAMWKARPVVASRIGGIQDQIVHGETGILLDDPLDLAAYGAPLPSLRHDPARAEAIGLEAKERMRHRYPGTRTLVQSVELYERHIRGEMQDGTGA